MMNILFILLMSFHAAQAGPEVFGIWERIEGETKDLGASVQPPDRGQTLFRLCLSSHDTSPFAGTDFAFTLDIQSCQSQKKNEVHNRQNASNRANSLTALAGLTA
jgi:hypothetical protein